MIRWILLATARAEPVPPPPDHVLTEPGFAFCTEPGRGGPEALAFCPLLEGLPPDRCPGLRETCAKGVAPPPEPRTGCDDEGGEARPGALAGEPEPPPAERVVTPPDLRSLLERLSGLLRWVFAFAVAALVLVLLRVFVGSFGRPKRSPVPRTDEVAAVTVEEALPTAPARDVLAAARAALAAGDLDEVVVLCRGAALKELHERGTLLLHRARTDREYVRALRAAPDQQEALRAILSAREGLRFGGRPVDATLASGVLAAAERIVGAALVLLLLSSAARAADARYQPFGDAALPVVLRAWGADVSFRLRSLSDLGPDTDVLLLDLYAVGATEEQLAGVRTWVEAGGVLWLAGVPEAGFPELGPTSVEACVPVVDPRFEALPAPATREATVRVYTAAVTPVVACGPFAAAQVLHLGSGVVVAFPDDEWLVNGAFVHPDTERFVGDLLNTGQIVDGWPTEDPAKVQLATVAAAQAPPSGGNNPFRSVANARLLPFVLQLLAAFAVLAAWKGWPFAPLRAPESTGRRSFSEHVRALGVRLLRSRASGVAARAVARYWHSRLGPTGLQFAAERAGRDPAAARAFASAVEARASSEDTRSRGAADHAFMEELWTITRGTTP